MIKKIRIYTTRWCPFCHMAKSLLAGKGVAFEEIAVDGDHAARQKMCDAAGGCWTVPQVFIGDRHVGGFDQMSELDRRGELDPLLADVPRETP